MVAILYPTKKPAALAAKLVAVGLWVAVKGGYRVHDYTDWNKTKDQVDLEREATRNRVASHRYKSRGNGVTSLPGNGVTNADVPDPLHSTPTPDPRSKVLNLAAEESEMPSTRPRLRAAAAAETPKESLKTRAAGILRDPSRAHWERPSEWPELVQSAEVFADALKLRPPRLGSGRDSAVKAFLEMFAAGFTPGELAEAARAARRDEFCQREIRDLSALTLPVVRRLLEARPVGDDTSELMAAVRGGAQ
jgi:hypothetical protein